MREEIVLEAVSHWNSGVDNLVRPRRVEVPDLDSCPLGIAGQLLAWWLLQYLCTITILVWCCQLLLPFPLPPSLPPLLPSRLYFSPFFLFVSSLPFTISSSLSLHSLPLFPHFLHPRAAFTTKTVKVGENSILFQIWDTAGQEKVHTQHYVYIL